ncbi:hypothetical protein TNCV_2256921 [Trichonephila clavipes]|nr:hypothetical protein TNCV_2256921 [Trichonephila clavipes]
MIEKPSDKFKKMYAPKRANKIPAFDWLSAGWRSWLGTGLVCPSLRVRPQSKLADFLDAENRQRPCRVDYAAF